VLIGDGFEGFCPVCSSGVAPGSSHDSPHLAGCVPEFIGIQRRLILIVRQLCEDIR
jgi:hypothetical protein